MNATVREWREKAARLLARPRGYDRLQLWTLSTLTSTIAAFTSPPILGEDLQERDFV